jgi:transcriptional regulator with XRE-family HTH domain
MDFNSATIYRWPKSVGVGTLHIVHLSADSLKSKASFLDASWPVVYATLRTKQVWVHMANHTRPTLGEFIRLTRVAAKLGLRELARLVDITPSYLSDIENDRRIPAEDVLKRIAVELRLDFGELMAIAGRVGDDAERYLKRHPAAATLFRRIAEKNLSEDELEKLLRTTEKLGE